VVTDTTTLLPADSPAQQYENHCLQELHSSSLVSALFPAEANCETGKWVVLSLVFIA